MANAIGYQYNGGQWFTTLWADQFPEISSFVD
jgi:hypothetical protein